MQEAEEREEFIDLQSSHITQYSKDGIPHTPWYVRQNLTNDNLASLPMVFSEEQVRIVVNFGKKFELKAFNAGIKFQKGKQNEVLLLKIAERENNIKFLEAENEKLAEALDQHIRGT